MKLYEIKEQYLQALNNIQLDEDTGEMLGFEELNSLNEVFEEKADNIACFVKELIANEEAIKLEEKALSIRRKTLNKKSEALKEYLSAQMIELGKEKIETARNAISFRKSSSVFIEDENLIPNQFIKEIITTSIDKIAIKQVIKEGGEVIGAKIIESQNIQIK